MIYIQQKENLKFVQITTFISSRDVKKYISYEAMHEIYIFHYENMPFQITETFTTENMKKKKLTFFIFLLKI